MSSNPPVPQLAVRHRMIVVRPRDRCVLLSSESSGDHLPAFTCEDRHTAEVDYLNAALLSRFGLRATVLRSLSHSAPIDGVVDRVHEIELRGGAPQTLSAGLQWRPLDAVELRDASDRSAFAQWQAESRSRRVIDGRDWTRRGWFARACEWIGEALRESGVAAPLEIRQLRSWAYSCVLSVDAPGTRFYFKALASGVELSVVAWLAEWTPSTVPRLIAVHPERRWLLMEACSGTKLEAVPDAAQWARAAGSYGQLQAGGATRTAQLRALGCPVRGIDTLVRHIETLPGDRDALRSGAPDGLTDAECGRLRAAVPELLRRCELLAASGVPQTIEHGDLWPGNIFVDAAQCVVIDWEDVAIAPPFFSLAPLTVGMIEAGIATPQALERLERSYLQAFELFAPAQRLHELLRVVAPLSFIEMAARYRRQRASVAALHPWMRDLVPQTLRLALARLP
jgi:Ser/Thr protein kinase RdoA (MazF antagonist)